MPVLPAAHVRRVRAGGMAAHSRPCDGIHVLSATTVPIPKSKSTLSRDFDKTNYDAVINSLAVNQVIRNDPNQVVLQLCSHRLRFRLTRLRYFLFLVNLIVLATAARSFNVWFVVVHVRRKLLPTEHFQINKLLKESIGPLLAHCVAYMDDFFVSCSSFLVIYYIIFGLRVSICYGGFRDTYCVVLAFPIVTVLAAAELLLAYIFWEIGRVLNDLDCSSLDLSYNSLSMIVDLRNFMLSNGHEVAVLFCMSSTVQMITMSLPFFLHDLPFQRLLYLDDCMFNDLAYAKTPGKHHTKEGEELLDQNNNVFLEIKKYPSAASSVTLNLCRPEFREFHRRNQIRAINQ